MTLAFQTDADISNSSRGGPRELQPWVSDHPEPLTPNKTNGSAKDAETFGGGGNGQWDQFATNERLFGATSDYKEELYTTKLNKSGPDFKKREKEAEKLAHEILNASHAVWESADRPRRLQAIRTPWRKETSLWRTGRRTKKRGESARRRYRLTADSLVSHGHLMHTSLRVHADLRLDPVRPPQPLLGLRPRQQRPLLVLCQKPMAPRQLYQLLLLPQQSREAHRRHLSLQSLPAHLQSQLLTPR